jgi:hypothetical protein
MVAYPKPDGTLGVSSPKRLIVVNHCVDMLVDPNP